MHHGIARGVAIIACIALSAITAGLAGNEGTRIAGDAPSGFDNETIETGSTAQADHDTDREKFDEVDDIAPDGLGPVYNAQACRECHQDPVSGSASQVLEQRAGHLDAEGRFANPDVPIEGDVIRGRNLINDRAISAEAHEFVPAPETILTNRLSLNLLGDGFVEAVDDQTLKDIRDRQCRSNDELGICGMVVFVPVLEAPGTRRVGRFGWKSQHASLLSFAADAYLNEMGITNRLQPDEVTKVSNPPIKSAGDPDENKVTEPNNLPDPADNREDIDHFARFMRATKVPPRDRSKDSPIVARGSKVFEQVGCGNCHQTTMVTLPAGTQINGGTFVVTEALGGKTFHPYSDFLLHDVGTGDGIAIAAGEHYGRRITKLFNAREAQRLNIAGEQLVDPLAQVPGDPALPRSGRSTTRARSFARSPACNAINLWRRDTTAETSLLFRELQCTANRIRTAPLWGLHVRSRFMHDGLSVRVEDAIARHAGEASRVISHFRDLPAGDKNAVIAFMRSL